MGGQIYASYSCRNAQNVTRDQAGRRFGLIPSSCPGMLPPWLTEPHRASLRVGCPWSCRANGGQMVAGQGVCHVSGSGKSQVHDPSLGPESVRNRHGRLFDIRTIGCKSTVQARIRCKSAETPGHASGRASRSPSRKCGRPACRRITSGTTALLQH
jgi:hypothetical protein